MYLNLKQNENCTVLKKRISKFILRVSYLGNVSEAASFSFEHLNPSQSFLSKLCPACMMNT